MISLLSGGRYRAHWRTKSYASLIPLSMMIEPYQPLSIRVCPARAGMSFRSSKIPCSFGPTDGTHRGEFFSCGGWPDSMRRRRGNHATDLGIGGGAGRDGVRRGGAAAG